MGRSRGTQMNLIADIGAHNIQAIFLLGCLPGMDGIALQISQHPLPGHGGIHQQIPSCAMQGFGNPQVTFAR